LRGAVSLYPSYRAPCQPAELRHNILVGPVSGDDVGPADVRGAGQHRSAGQLARANLLNLFVRRDVLPGGLLVGD
jgi:hypothetical protein